MPYSQARLLLQKIERLREQIEKMNIKDYSMAVRHDVILVLAASDDLTESIKKELGEA